MNTGEFNQRLEKLVEEASNSGMSDEKITRLLTQQVTVMGSEGMRKNTTSNPKDARGEDFTKWKSVQQSSMAIRALME